MNERDINYQNDDFPLDDDYLENPASSAYECTGLMPTPPQSQSEFDAYNDLVEFSPKPIVKNDKREKN